MNLTDFQKKVVLDIYSNSIKKCDDFLSKYFQYTEKEFNQGSISGGWYTFNFKQIVKIPVNEKLFISQLIEFVSLIDYLQRNHFIFLIKRSYNTERVFPIFQESELCVLSTNRIFYELIEDLYPKEFNPLPELLQFINNGFHTNDEIAYINEQKGRKEAQSLTKTIAIISIIATLLSTLITILFNYLTYTTDRQVIIKNPQDFNDTLKVIIIDKNSVSIEQKIITDSLKRK